MDERKHVLKIRGLDVSFKTSAGMVNAPCAGRFGFV